MGNPDTEGETHPLITKIREVKEVKVVGMTQLQLAECVNAEITGNTVLYPPQQGYGDLRLTRLTGVGTDKGGHTHQTVGRSREERHTYHHKHHHECSMTSRRDVGARTNQVGMESALNPQNIYRVAQIGIGPRRYKSHPPTQHQQAH